MLLCSGNDLYGNCSPESIITAMIKMKEARLQHCKNRIVSVLYTRVFSFSFYVALVCQADQDWKDHWSARLLYVDVVPDSDRRNILCQFVVLCNGLAVLVRSKNRLITWDAN